MGFPWKRRMAIDKTEAEQKETHRCVQSPMDTPATHSGEFLKVADKSIITSKEL